MLLDSAKWTAAEHEEMDSVLETWVIGRTTSYLPLGVAAVSAMFAHALKWTVAITIERNKSRWVVRGFPEIPDVHYDPLA